MQLPDKFVDEMIRILGPEGYEEYLESYSKPRVYGLRVNTAKISVEDFVKICPWEIEPIPWIPNGFYYDGENISPAKHPFYYAGLYYLQEPSAMTPARLLPVEAGDKILDICAAPGGKSTELGAKLINANTEAEIAGKDMGCGILVSNDISSSRARALLKNLEVSGIGNCLVTCEEPQKLSGRFPEFFDKILIDAPCSGEGMFRKERKMVAAWTEHGPEFFGKIQRSILNEAATMLKPGGMMLYSTCTFSSYENEGSISDFLESHDDFHICDIRKLPGGDYEGFCCGMPDVVENGTPELTGAIRIWPHKMMGEGHFVCVLQKEGSKPENINGLPVRKASKGIFLDDSIDKGSWNSFMQAETYDKGLVPDLHGEQLFFIPEFLPNLKGLRFLRSGLYAGDVKKGRFEPSQALAMTLNSPKDIQVIDLEIDDSAVIKYLKCETIEIANAASLKNGWTLVRLHGHPLGWGKINNGILKNKYLSGWRINW